VTEKGINNQPKNQVNIPSFKIEQSQKADFTANSGMFLIAELIKKLDIIEKLAQLNIFHRKKIGEAVHILTLVINQHTGGDAILDTQYVKKDGALRTIFGNMHIPAPHTSGDFLERFTEESVERLRTILHKMQDKQLKRLSKRLCRKIILSLDSTVYEVYANCKENSSTSFKHIFGYHPLLLHIHNTGELLDIIFRTGSAFTSTGAEEMLRYNIQRLKPFFDEIILLADAGYRLESLKASLKRRNKKLKTRGELEVAKFEHTVPAWSTQYRFVYKRKQIIVDDLSNQSELFEETEEYFYHGYVTNELCVSIVFLSSI